MADNRRLIDAIAYCKMLREEMDYLLELDKTKGYKTLKERMGLEVAIADLGDMPTVDPMEVCIQEVLRYIDQALNRQRYDSIWLDEKGEKHRADVGYSGEWWEDCMKPELLRMFSNVGAKMDGDGNG